MARYIRDQVLNQPDDFVQYMMNDFVTKHGFHRTEFKGEIVYRAGKGLLEIPKFLTWSYQNGNLHLEAWTRNAWFPGVYGRENAMTGFTGCIPKSAYKADVDQLINLLYQNVTRPVGMAPNGMPPQPGMTPNGMPPQPGMAPNGMPQQPGMMPNGMPGGPVYVQGVDTSRYSTIAMVLGIVSLVGVCVPMIGIIFGSLGIVYGIKGQTSIQKGKATAGLVCGLIGLILGILVFALSIIYYFRSLNV